MKNILEYSEWIIKLTLTAVYNNIFYITDVYIITVVVKLCIPLTLVNLLNYCNVTHTLKHTTDDNVVE